MTQPPSPIVDEAGRALDRLEMAIRELAGEVAPGGPEDRAFAAINELRASLVSPPKAWKPVAWVSAACPDYASGPIQTVSPPKAGAGKAVGWDTLAERLLEQRAFNAANRDDVPEDVRKTVADLWRQYCLAAQPNHEARRDGVRVTDGLIEAAIRAGDPNFDAAARESAPIAFDRAKQQMRRAIEAVRALLPPLGDGSAEIVEACARVADEVRIRLTQQAHRGKLNQIDENAAGSADGIAARIRALSPNPGDRS